MRKASEIKVLEEKISSLEETIRKANEGFNKGWKMSENRISLPKGSDPSVADGWRSREYFFLKKEVSSLRDFFISIKKDVSSNVSQFLDLIELENLRIESAASKEKIEILEKEVDSFRKSQDEWFANTSQMYREIKSLSSSNKVLGSEALSLRGQLDISNSIINTLIGSLEVIQNTVKNMRKTMSSREVSDVTGISEDVISMFLGDSKNG